jgi:hypothetical protein
LAVRVWDLVALEKRLSEVDLGAGEPDNVLGLKR